MLDKDIIINEARKEKSFSLALTQLGFVPAKHEYSKEVLSYYSMVKDINDLEKMPESNFRNKLLDQLRSYMENSCSLVDEVKELTSELEYTMKLADDRKNSIETLQKEVQVLKDRLSHIQKEYAENSFKDYKSLERRNNELRKMLKLIYSRRLFRVLILGSEFRSWYDDNVVYNEE